MKILVNTRAAPLFLAGLIALVAGWPVLVPRAGAGKDAAAATSGPENGTVKIVRDDGGILPFSPGAAGTFEVVNDRVNIVLPSAEGMLLQFTGIEVPALRETETRVNKYRALLLHTTLQAEAFTSDTVKDESRLKLEKLDGGAGGKKIRVVFSGRLKGKREELRVVARFVATGSAAPRRVSN